MNEQNHANNGKRSSARSCPPRSAVKKLKHSTTLLTERAQASTQKHAQRLSKTTKKAADAKKRENRFLA